MAYTHPIYIWTHKLWPYSFITDSINDQELANHNIQIDFIFDFKIDFKKVEDRIVLRSQQEKRTDDNLNVIKTRLEEYTKETMPVSELFSNRFRKKYFVIDASVEISQIQKNLMKIIKKRGEIGEF